MWRRIKAHKENKVNLTFIPFQTSLWIPALKEETEYFIKMTRACLFLNLFLLMRYFPLQMETIGLVVRFPSFDQMEGRFLATQTALTCQSMYVGPQLVLTHRSDFLLDRSAEF